MSSEIGSDKPSDNSDWIEPWQSLERYLGPKNGIVDSLHGAKLNLIKPIGLIVLLKTTDKEKLALFEINFSNDSSINFNSAFQAEELINLKNHLVNASAEELAALKDISLFLTAKSKELFLAGIFSFLIKGSDKINHSLTFPGEFLDFNDYLRMIIIDYEQDQAAANHVTSNSVVVPGLSLVISLGPDFAKASKINNPVARKTAGSLLAANLLINFSGNY